VIRDRLRGEAPPEPRGPLRGWQWPFAFFDGLSGLIPFLALAGSRLDIAVMALMAYSLIDIADSVRPIFSARRA
jgi:hypothetical protein